MKQIKITSRLTNRETESFNLYLKDINDLSLLTIPEENALAAKACQGDQKAKDELICRNLRFVVSVAKQYATQNNPIEDLINEGNIGLILAIEKFDPNMGWRFLSYAVWWIRKVIYDYMSKHSKLVRIPPNKLSTLSKLDKRIHELEQKLGRTVDMQEVVDEFGLDFVNDDMNLIGILTAYSMDSLDRELGGDDSSTHTTLADLISDETAYKPSDHLITEINIKEEISRIIDVLPPRSKRVMISLYGLNGELPMTLKEVGDELGVTREMVRQIKEKSLKNLRIALKNSTIRTS